MKIIRIAFGVFCVMGAIAFMPSAASIIFLVAALFALPIKPIQNALSSIIKKPYIIAIISILLFLIGCYVAVDGGRDTSIGNPANGNDAALYAETEKDKNKQSSETEVKVNNLESKLDEMKKPRKTNPETEPEPEEIGYKSGQYKVGTDIPAGIYCLWEDGYFPNFTISEDANGDEIIDWHTYKTNYIVEVQEGEYFKISSGYAVPYDGEKIAVLQDGYLCEGFYAVGTDIPAGEYKVVEEADAVVPSITTYNDLRGKIVDWIVLDGDRYVELKDGQYVSVSDCKIYVGE